MGVEADEGLAGAHVAQDVAHGVDFHFIEIEFAHFFGNAVDMFLFAAAFTGEFNDVLQETGHILFIAFGGFFDFFVRYCHENHSYILYNVLLIQTAPDDILIAFRVRVAFCREDQDL